MLLMISFDDRGMSDRVRAFKDSQQFWQEYLAYPEFRRRMEIEKPFFNPNCSFGQKIDHDTPFPMYFIPDGAWVHWDTFKRTHITDQGDQK